MSMSRLSGEESIKVKLCTVMKVLAFRLKQMKLQVPIILTCIIIFFWIQQSSCDQLSDTSGINKWKCKCSAPYQGNQSFILEANCSTSCACNPDAGGSGSIWTCMCAADGFPKVADKNDKLNCFTSCNCSSGGFLNVTPTSKTYIASKVVVIILLLCAIITSFAFLASVVCYLSLRKKLSIHSPALSAYGQASYNSFSNLLSHKSLSLLEMRTSAGSPTRHNRGCFHIASWPSKTKYGTIYGTIIQFSYSELENATNNFSDSNIVGRGGSSLVYRGILKDGRIVAVKRLKTQGGPDAESLFLTEIELLSRLHHCHLVPLLGYCLESQGKHTEKLLVYQYIPRGNLRDCLDSAGKERMNWASRVMIAMGAARGLEYLHVAAAPRILHRDVKSTNILLDEDWQAKVQRISDLGMAKRLSIDGLTSGSNSPDRMQGTFGYFAPEYAIIGRASLKSDVFSFGVVLLELITGQHPIQKSAKKGEESLVIWATPRLQDSSRVINELPDPRLKGLFPKEEMQIMAYLAKECLLLDPEDRPTMSEVVQILSTIAAEKSKRRNITANIFQGTSAYSSQSESFIERADSNPLSEQQLYSKTRPDGEADLRQTPSCRSQAMFTLSFDDDSSFYIGDESKEDIISAEDMQRLLLLTSNARSCHASDNVIVDLSEPQFESFCMTNATPPR